MGPHSHYLKRIFEPSSIAVVGASERESAVGTRVFANLIASGFHGDLYPVNPKHDSVQGRTCYPDVESIDDEVDLAVIATPAPTVPEIMRQCGEKDIAGAVILSAGFAEAGARGERLQNAVLETARNYRMRVIGPNCLGIIRPAVGLNATFSNNDAHQGGLALVSQSGALCTAILDWAETQEVGFSAVASLGDSADVDFGDVLDYLALDRRTRSILLYVEGVRQSRRFMSGLRSAARMKPVIVVKAGRHAEGSKAAVSHTGALVGADDVFDAALERAGAVRADTIQGLFSAAQILASGARVRGDRLAIVTNGGGPGVMATDRAVELGVRVPQLRDDTLQRLDEILPAHWSHGNPVDILGDAPPERYAQSLEACLGDDQVDGVLAMLTPQAMTEPEAAARAVVDTVKDHRKAVLACWLGDKQVASSWALFARHKLPAFDTPESSVEAFSYLASYRRSQELLMQVPGPLAERSEPDTEGARLIIENVLAEGRHSLTIMESKAVLNAFRIPVNDTVEVRSGNEALIAAESLGFPVALKINSVKLTHKSDVGGVRLNIANARDVRNAYSELIQQVREKEPDARIDSVVVERMHTGANTRELLLGVLRDPAFGPVISFGSGGTAVEVMQDRSVALPPLNSFIIRTMVERTRVSRLLGSFRRMPPVKGDALHYVLQRISEMVCELPEVMEMDINPLIADEHGVVAVDARFTVDYRPVSADRYAHMAIHPYPAHAVSHWQLPDGTDITLRPIRPEDAELEQSFVRSLSEETKYFRFMQSLEELTPQMLVRFTQIDYDREMAFVAVTEDDGDEEELGVARYTINPDRITAEFAIVVADAWQGKGIGSRLMRCLMDAARQKGVEVMEGEVLARNANMLRLVKALDFTVRTSDQDPNIKLVRKRL